MNIINVFDNSKRKFDIIDGPSRETVFDALKYAYDKDFSRTLRVEFRVQVSYSKIKMHNVKINSLAHGSGTGYNFLLTGYCSINSKFGAPGRPEYKNYKFDMYYNTSTRKGHVKFKAC